MREQVRSFKFPKREKMDALKERWVQECGYTPRGNVEGSEWASASRDAQVSEEACDVDLMRVAVVLLSAFTYDGQAYARAVP